MLKNLKRKLDLFKHNSAIVRLARIGIASRNNEITLLKKEINQWRQVSEIINKKIMEEVDPRLGRYIAGSGLITSGGLDQLFKPMEEKLKNNTSDIESIISRTARIESEMKATDKVFFLSDRVEKLLIKLENK